jgi:uncharacterized protein YjbI with pentapeptide repeats
VLLAIVLIGGTLAALRYHNAPWPWQEPPPAGTDPLTFGDVTELLIVPLTLAVVAYVFSTYQRRQDREIAEQEHTTEREIAQERNEEAELQTYFDRMSELMLTHNLRPSSSSNEGEERPDETKATALHNSTASTIARARTLAVLRSIKSPVRKGSIVRFLYESELINKGDTAINLSGADLRKADLDRANLRWANLHKANLSEANLFEAILTDADLSSATMHKTTLCHADLQRTNLIFTYLIGADLRRAILSEKTNLGGTILDSATLKGVVRNGVNLDAANIIDKHPTGTRQE